MKSNSNTRPATTERVAQNRYRYNYNIVESQRTEEVDGQTITETTYDYDYVEFWGQPNYSTIVRLILREEKDETQEFELINDYNAFMEGMTEDSSSVTKYKAWLTRVSEVKAMVRADIEGNE